MEIHYLKINTKYLDRIISGQKTFEIRKNDRDYQVGDQLFLKESNPDCEILNARNVKAKIIYTSTFQQKEGYIVLGIDIGG